MQLKTDTRQGRKFRIDIRLEVHLWSNLCRNVLPEVLGLVTLLCSLNSAMLGQSASATDGQLLLTGGTIYTNPTAKPIINGIVLIRDGRIAAVGRKGVVRIPKGIPTLNCSGLIITAGFWNSHVHFTERKWADAANIPAPELARQLQVMLTRYGFTSVFDLGSPWDNTRQIRERIESGEIAGPKIRSTGEMLLKKGWMPSETVMRTLGSMALRQYEVTNASEALAAATKLLDAGTDGLKMYAAASFPPYATLPDEVICAAVQEAHRRNKPVFAHPTSRDGLLAAVKGGVNIIAHTTPQSGGPWDETVIATMRRAQVALIPTLKVWNFVLRHDRSSLSDQWAQTNIGQLRAWLASGGMVLFGTDVGAGIDDYVQGEEYTLMAEAGMTFRQILASLTTAPAGKFGDADKLGQIAKGFIADLVVLNGDPSRDIRMFASVRYTIRNGKIIYADRP
jgi:imidazolonepropionase-like amidohydrolase